MKNSAGLTWYQALNRKTVDQRANGLQKEYLDKVKKVDEKYLGTPKDHIGPLQQRLREFGEIVSLVAGQYGEVSQDFHLLLSRLATSKARMVSQNEGRPISDNERGLILNQLRRRLAVTIIKSQSNSLLSRLSHMNPGAKEAAQRRAVAKQRQSWSALEKDTIAHFEALV